MPIGSERSDARLSQCGIVIGIRQGFCWFSLSSVGEFCRSAVVRFFGPGRKEPVGRLELGPKKSTGPRRLFVIFAIAPTFGFPDRFALQVESVRCMHQSVQDTVGHGWIADLRVPLRYVQLTGQ